VALWCLAWYCACLRKRLSKCITLKRDAWRWPPPSPHSHTLTSGRNINIIMWLCGVSLGIVRILRKTV
ncbi:unnamed protein product, partial [Callosobruchus maculatus]